ncbi:ABC transporter permease [Paracoccus denitrificans]|jgi:peptide/nickel transport system permease protein|uniref:Binding-protein-dependent transport systems inner membrane component n=1 Tax=Paracoccus denitrificans (strain Pd 1222) TaxID=318586 RepID=A1B1Q3_PARDP|nr:ABC transporter permease [Paracoccus denitrificans]ABL69447.1 binding-protein-dependent transport systems inner membrane component [Paracoccus denitrificans PD1222]MCU7427823.1 ABC transporter permease [Paracoccus denitrificans]QAR27412.1 ABC transporter permease [Paracoccus denitrificans]UPV96442.1 ABC transporter permease [Paracoccus denitrificans]WQO34846.1 ABC transporter permease [Paracoccus denitrificans]
MIRALGYRALQAVLVAVLVGVLTFLMMQALPGDMAFRIAAGRYGYDAVNVAAAEAVRQELGLDRPAIAAFGVWVMDLLRLDFGTSVISGASVIDEIRHQLGASLQLAGAALALSLLIGPPVGVLAGLRAGGWLDRGLLVVSTALRSVPQFLMGLILIVLVSIHLGWLPAAGYGKPAHFILPALTLALGLGAVSARIARDAMAGVAASPFYAFGRWKGLSEGQLFRRHGLRNIGVALVTFLGLQFAMLVEGVVVIESIFGWPGIGHALVHAIFGRDVPMVQGTALLLGLGFVVLNALVDLAAHWIDPRGGVQA